MDELIKQVTDRAGIPADKAKLAVNTVLGFLKSKLPAPVAGQIDTALAGGAIPFADVAKGAAEFVGAKK
jgi:hypothetical protein